MFRPIYEPRTRAKEYSDLAINIYTGCNHGCWYCYAKKMHDRWKPNEDFTDVKPREGIVEATKQQLASGKYKGKKIMLCFTCDPYPALIDTTVTREVIKVIKEAGAHVQILTKGGDRARRDFDLLDSEDSFGITLTGEPEPLAAVQSERIQTLIDIASQGIKTWVSFEPVIYRRRSRTNLQGEWL
jgi:DNA repair photolyase